MPNRYNFSDVFISYARANKDEIKPIGDKLKADGYEPWADWEDIHYGSEWLEEIKAGIDSANTFAFFVSPASVRSEHCRMEIDHAIESCKHILPILFEEISDEDRELMHPEIGKHHWIDYTTMSFDDFYRTIINTLSIDRKQREYHSLYLVSAKNWEENGRNDSYLLHGIAAQEADIWLKNIYGSETTIHALQERFIFHSIKKFHDDRQRHDRSQLIRFIEFRILPAFFITWFTVWRYSFVTLPNPEITGYQRFILTLGIGYTTAILLATLVLVADELTKFRYSNNTSFRTIFSFIYTFALTSSMFGFLQAMFADARLDIATIFLGWLGLGMPLWLHSTFKLSGLRSFVVSFIALFALIFLTHQTPNAPWQGGRLALFYFNDSSELFSMGLFLSFFLSLACFGLPILRDLWSNLPQPTRERLAPLWAEELDVHAVLEVLPDNMKELPPIKRMLKQA